MQDRFDLRPFQSYAKLMNSQWFVYLLRCADDTLYCGITTDVDRRLAQHNAGSASKYTRTRTPVRMEIFRPVESKSQALKTEYRIKNLPREKKVPFLQAMPIKLKTA